MTDIEKLFLAAYPLWPKQLLQKFSSLLSFEIAKFNPAINPQIVEQYERLGLDQKNNIEPYADNVSYLLHPSNASKVSQVYYGKTVLPVNIAVPIKYTAFFNQELLQNYKWYQGKVLYDIRIYESVLPSVIIDYEKNGRPYDFSFLWIMSYSQIEVQPLRAIALVVCSVKLKKYSGALSVLAMIENGVKVDIDQNLLSEFVTFLNAYSKYSAQLAAGSSLQSEKNKQDLQQYKNAISDKLTARKNELNDLRTQISFAARNETASAKRDMQNLALNAQSLMLQLQEKLQ